MVTSCARAGAGAIVTTVLLVITGRYPARTV
jgi:hypothetical protein